MEQSSEFRRCFKIIHKENVEPHFWNVWVYYRELEYIRTHLVKKEIEKIFNQKIADNEKIDDRIPIQNQNEQSSPIYPKLELSMELNLFYKCYMFVLRQSIDEFLYILHELNFIFTKDGVKGNQPPEDFNKFFSKFYENKFDHLEEEILEFFKKYAKEFAIMRNMRNNLKADGKILCNFSLQKGRPVVMMVYNINEVNDKSLKRFIGEPDIPSDIKSFHCDLEKLMEDYSKIVSELQHMLEGILCEKCIKLESAVASTGSQNI